MGPFLAYRLKQKSWRDIFLAGNLPLTPTDATSLPWFDPSPSMCTTEKVPRCPPFHSHHSQTSLCRISFMGGPSQASAMDVAWNSTLGHDGLVMVVAGNFWEMYDPPMFLVLVQGSPWIEVVVLPLSVVPIRLLLWGRKCHRMWFEDAFLSPWPPNLPQIR
jgi:hypothetical protein